LLFSELRRLVYPKRYKNIFILLCLRGKIGIRSVKKHKNVLDGR
jgi:hypothetical protein